MSTNSSEVEAGESKVISQRHSMLETNLGYKRLLSKKEKKSRGGAAER